MGVVINGVYYRNEDIARPVDGENITHKQWSHSEQRKTHAKDIVQPFDSNGKPNPAFIEAWPEESKQRGFLPSDEKLKEL